MIILEHLEFNKSVFGLQTNRSLNVISAMPSQRPKLPRQEAVEVSHRPDVRFGVTTTAFRQQFHLEPNKYFSGI